MPKPYIHADLIDAAAALVLCQHDSPLVAVEVCEGETTFAVEEPLQAARIAASAYLVSCFNAAVTWNEDDE